MSSPDVDRWIVASSGGFVGTGLWGVMRPGRIFTPSARTLWSTAASRAVGAHRFW